MVNQGATSFNMKLQTSFLSPGTTISKEGSLRSAIE
jgi:hypothetical protein